MFSPAKSALRAWPLSRYLTTASTPSSTVPASKESEQVLLVKSSEKVRKDALRKITRVDNFIPITRRDLFVALINKQNFFSQKEQKLLNQLVGGMQHSLLQKMNATHEKMKEMYDYLNPDKDTYATRDLSQQERIEQETNLLQDLTRIMSMGNFIEIPRASLEILLQPHDTKGVQVSVNTRDLTTCRVWVRGWGQDVLSNKSVINLLRHKLAGWVGVRAQGDQGEVIASRLLLAIRKGSDKKLLLKAFKDVNLMRIETLLPNAKVKMKEFDKMVQIGTISVGAISLLIKFLVFGSTPLSASWTLIIICGIVLSRTWFGYTNKRNAYLVELMQTLYYNNLANNRGVLAYLTDRAIDERLKQLVLAYSFLLCVPNRRGVMGTAHTTLPPQYYHKAKLKTTVEDWVLSEFEIKIDFDVEDALSDLSDLGILKDERGQLMVSPIEESLHILPKPVYEWSELDSSGLEL